MDATCRVRSLLLRRSDSLRFIRAALIRAALVLQPHAACRQDKHDILYVRCSAMGLRRESLVATAAEEPLNRKVQLSMGEAAVSYTRRAWRIVLNQRFAIHSLAFQRESNLPF